jgi:putative endonuclease
MHRAHYTCAYCAPNHLHVLLSGNLGRSNCSLQNGHMCYTYVLRSECDGRFYTGATRNLRARIRLHNEGKVVATIRRRPLARIYYEACADVNDAFRGERFLKCGKGKRFLRRRLASFLSATGIEGLERP